MRLGLPATLVAILSASAAVSPAAVAQSAPQPPVLLASAAPHAPAPLAAARLFTRVDVGITPDWPAGETQFADYAVQEIEAGTVSGDLYVRWAAFGLDAQAFTVEVSAAGQPFVPVATVAATGAVEYGVHVLGLAAALYDVRMRETASDGTVVVSTPVRVRV